MPPIEIIHESVGINWEKTLSGGGSALIKRYKASSTFVFPEPFGPIRIFFSDQENTRFVWFLKESRRAEVSIKYNN
jgi:hypothetical protein